MFMCIGKTTIVREAARVLAEANNNVCVIDTSNEIGGDGTIPHPCIGLARRMMVPSLDAQSKVMVECVQNHTPHVMGRFDDVIISNSFFSVTFNRLFF